MVDFSKLEGFEEARAALAANQSPRSRDLATLEAWACGRQYQGKQDWFAAGPSAKPLWERAPCFVYLMARESIESKVDLVLGEGHFPEFTTNPGEGDPLDGSSDEEADQAGSDVEESKLLDALIDRMVDQAGYKAASREALYHAQEVGTAVLIFGARNGRLFCDTTKAQWCEPELGDEGEVLSLTIQYPYFESYRDKSSKKWAVRTMLYRRVIDEKSDTTFQPANASKDGDEPTSWKVAQKFEHGLGFCPVIWYPFFRGVGIAGQIDGHAPHALLLDEIRALDFALSQRHRAALFLGDPQWTEVGVEAGYNPSGAGRTAIVPGTPQGGAPTGVGEGDNPQTTHWEYGGKDSQSARVKAPGVVWQYPDPNTKVQLHALPGDALKALDEHAKDLRIKLCEMLAHVPLDPESIRHVISGKAVDALRRRELNRCDQIRDDFADGCLVPSIQMLIRIASYFSKQKDVALDLAGIDVSTAALAKYADSTPPISIGWPSYTRPEPAEELAIIQATMAAYTGKIITLRQAVSKTAGIFDVENVDETVDAIEEEAAARQQRAMEQMQQEQKSLHGLVNGDGEKNDPGAKKPGREEPGGAPQG